MKRILAGAVCGALLVPFLLTGCGRKSAESAGTASGIDKNNFDPGVRAQDDLYRATNGVWLKNTPIPADKSNFGAFTKLADDAQIQLRAIIEELAAKPDKKPGSVEQKVGDYYAAFMDQARADSLGLKPIEPELAKIDALRDRRDIPALMAELGRSGIDVPLTPFVHQDAKDSTQYAGDFFQSGLGLPDRDYYLIDDAKFSGIRDQYRTHVQKMFELAGVADAASIAKDVIALETRIAQVHWDKVANRDPVKTYNPYEPAQLPGLAPDLDWAAYLKAVGYGSLKQVLVAQPSYVTGLGKLLRGTPVETWRAYFKWKVLHARAALLSTALVDEDFAFDAKTLNGQQENRPRWKRGVAGIEGAMGEAVGEVYVDRHFPAKNKARMEELVQNIIRSYYTAIDGLDWMGDDTKKAAKLKLSKFKYKIGYPSKWRDYSKLEIVAGDSVGNSARAEAFEYDRNIAKLGKPIDREEWGMTPQTVNAYYNPEKNEIVFPAAILQPPFFNVQADDAANYGGIGAVIGHEISHGFDDEGSQYDGDGNLKAWWTDADRKKFEALGAALAAQYDTYEPIKGYHVNGKFTLGENIADLGGLTIAHAAYRLSLKDKPAKVIDGMTGDQRFFAGWAQVWRRNYREENLLTRLKTDPHSPSENRCNGVVINHPAFYEAYAVKPGDKLYRPPAERIKIW